MGKKKGKKATEDEVTKENEGQEKPASPPTRTGVPTKQTQKRTANDIDGIFGTVKKSKTPRAIEDSKGGEAKDRPKKVEGSIDDIFGVDAGKQRKRTEEGYTIYHEDELGINKGGDTELCPFDCDCCF